MGKAKKTVITNNDGFPVLGWLVNWYTKDLSLKREDLLAKLKECGIPGEIAKETLPKNALKRAVQYVVKKMMPESSYNKLRFTVEDGNDKMSLVIATVNKVAGSVKFEQVSLVSFDKLSHKVTVDGQFQKEIEDEFNVKKAYYSADQFRTVILRYAKRYCAAITYLETGNIYFIPSLMEGNLNKLKDLFGKLGPGVRLIAKEEIDCKQVRSTMWNITVNEVSKRIVEMQEDLDEMPEEAKENSVDIRLKKYDELKVRVQMFESVLHGKADKLKDQLDSLTKTIKEKLVI